jgi:hypothetical protein
MQRIEIDESSGGRGSLIANCHTASGVVRASARREEQDRTSIGLSIALAQC